MLGVCLEWYKNFIVCIRIMPVRIATMIQAHLSHSGITVHERNDDAINFFEPFLVAKNFNVHSEYKPDISYKPFICEYPGQYEMYHEVLSSLSASLSVFNKAHIFVRLVYTRCSYSQISIHSLASIIFSEMTGEESVLCHWNISYEQTLIMNAIVCTEGQLYKDFWHLTIWRDCKHKRIYAITSSIYIYIYGSSSITREMNRALSVTDSRLWTPHSLHKHLM